MEEDNKKKAPMTDEERMELAAKMDQELDDYIESLEKRPYTEGWPEENWQEEMEKHPFFMTKSPEAGEPMSPLLEGMQQLKYDETDNTPEELAAAYKDDGNFHFKCKKYRMAVIGFTEGLRKKCNDTALNAKLYNNRSAAHYFLKNYRSCLNDCKAALKLQYPYPKVQCRAAQCCLAIGLDEECIQFCDELLATDDTNKMALKLRADAVSAKKLKDRTVRKKGLIRRKTEAEERELMKAINERGIRVETRDGTGVSFCPREEQFLPEGYTGVHLVEGRLVWPMVLVYLEYSTSDFIQEFHEDCTILSQLETVFENRPEWDIEHKYDVEKLHVYFEDADERRLVLVDPQLTLKQVLSNPRLIMSATPSKRNRRGKQKTSKKSVLLDNRSGFSGKPTFSLDKILFSNIIAEKWPEHNILSGDADGDNVLSSILQQDVGVELKPLNNIDVKHYLNDFISIINTFIHNHRKCKYAYLMNQFKKSNLPLQKQSLYRFLAGIIRKVVPLELFGDTGNRRRLLMKIKRLITISRFQWMRISVLLRYLKTDKVSWLNDVPGAGMKQNCFAKVIVWLVEHYVLVLLNSFFYITNTAFSKYELAFFCKRKWQSIQEIALGKLTQQKKLEEITTGKVILITKNKDSPPLGRLRFLPKKNDTRPIIITRYQETMSNNHLSDVLHLLKALYTRRGRNIQHISEFPDKWHEIRSHWMTTGRPQLYFVRVDVSDAYGSVKHDQLKKVLIDELRTKIPRGGHLNLKIFELTKGNIKKTYKHHGHFDHISGQFELPKGYDKMKLICDKEVNAEELLGKAMRLVTWQTVKAFNKKMYILKCGIAQGARLSAALCNLYYDHMDSSYRSQFEDNGTLFRLMDDYLYITPDSTLAHKFLQLMSTGIPEYGCIISKRKTSTNLDCCSTPITFFGFSINPMNLEVSANLSVYVGRNMASFLGLNSRGSEGMFMKARMQKLSCLDLKPMLLDLNINSRETVLKNIQATAFLNAFRFHCYVVNLLDLRTLNHRFLMTCIHVSTAGLVKSVRRCEKRLKQDPSTSFCDAAKYLSYIAFRIKLASHSGIYKHVIRILKSICSNLAKKLEEDSYKELEVIGQEKMPSIFKLFQK